jgi:hypothetical protein
MGRNGEALRTYRMEDIYPTEIAAIDLGMDTNDTVEEYGVTFAVNNWHSDMSTGFDVTGARDSNWEIGVRGRVQVGPVSVGVNTTFGG